MLTIYERKQIKDMLFHGSSKLIAKKAGVSRIAVANWLAGKFNSEKIENAAIDLCIEERERTEEKLKAAGLL